MAGIPCQAGSAVRGCVMGPDALRTAGLYESLAELGHEVRDIGNLSPAAVAAKPHPRFETQKLEEAAGWIAATVASAEKLSAHDSFPLFMGGDRTASAGAIAGIAKATARKDKPLFVLWLDAHAGFASLEAAKPGVLHETILAYLTGQEGFAGHFPPVESLVDPANICLFGTRSVGVGTQSDLSKAGVNLHDVGQIDVYGAAPLIQGFLANVAVAGGNLHVSLDLDLLSGKFAPAVQTQLPGGLTAGDVQQVMEILRDSELVTSFDITELNPFHDDRGRTAMLAVELVSGLFGARLSNRPAAIA